MKLDYRPLVTSTTDYLAKYVLLQFLFLPACLPVFHLFELLLFAN